LTAPVVAQEKENPIEKEGKASLKNPTKAFMMDAGPPRCLSLAERVERALRANGYPALRTIEVSVEGCRVVLKGRVPSYYMKQMAQVVSLAVAEVQELCNEVEVIPTAALAPTGVEGRFFVFKQRREGL
jgi:hypothetical protein